MGSFLFLKNPTQPMWDLTHTFTAQPVNPAQFNKKKKRKVKKRENKRQSNKLHVEPLNQGKNNKTNISSKLATQAAFLTLGSDQSLSKPLYIESSIFTFNAQTFFFLLDSFSDVFLQASISLCFCQTFCNSCLLDVVAEFLFSFSSLSFGSRQEE